MPGFPVLSVSRSLLRLQSVESMMLSNHLILRRRRLLPSVFPGVRVCSGAPALRPGAPVLSPSILSHADVSPFFTAVRNRAYFSSLHPVKRCHHLTQHHPWLLLSFIPQIQAVAIYCSSCLRHLFSLLVPFLPPLL